MRYGIFGDIHSNLEAFGEVLNAYKNEGIDRYICIGDIVGYGVDACGCIEMIKGLGAGIVCGSHDRASVGLFSTAHFNHIARLAVEWTSEIMGEEERKFLRPLELVIDERDFTVVHSSLYRPGLFYYMTDIPSARRCFLNMEKGLCFVGHSHIPGVFFMDEDRIGYGMEASVKLKQGVKYIVNVGSVGQPRDNNPLAAYSIFDSGKKTVEIKRISYDIEGAKNKILKSSLPDILGYRLVEGR